MFKTNKDITLVYNSEIIEWDMKSGNISVMLYYNLVPEHVAKKIATFPDKKRKIIVGNMQRDNKEFAKNLENGFNNIVNEFITLNQLSAYDIISIKRDAIFVKNRDIRYSSIGDYVLFRPKNHYHAYLYLDKMEFYFGSDRKIDIKGINDKKSILHKDGILNLLNDVIEMKEQMCSKIDIHTYLKKFTDYYLNGLLPFEYYRNLNDSSMYTMKMVVDGEYYSYEVDSIDEDMIPNVNLRYNYEHVILPLIQTILNN